MAPLHEIKLKVLYIQSMLCIQITFLHLSICICTVHTLHFSLPWKSLVTLIQYNRWRGNMSSF